MAEAAAMTGRPAAIVEMVQAGEILAFDLAEQAASVLVLLRKYVTTSERRCVGRSAPSMRHLRCPRGAGVR